MTRSPMLASLAALVLLAACASDPPPPPAPTTVALSLEPAADMNGGLPTQVKVYYLTSEAAFTTADFFSLFDAAEATLGDDLITGDAYLLAPGTPQSASKLFEAQQPVAIGVVAGFGDIDQPGWRALEALTPRAANTVEVALSGSTVTLSAAAEAPEQE